MLLCSSPLLLAQTGSFSLEDCIAYALENSTEITRSENNVLLQSTYLKQAKASRLPSLEFTAKQNLNATNAYSSTSDKWHRTANASLTASLSSQFNLYKGAKSKNTIIQNSLNLESAEWSVQAEKEAVSLNILALYIDVLSAKENLENTRLQLEATRKQLLYTEVRNEAGILPRSELLYVKSQLAIDKSSKVDAESNLRVALVALMQMMNMPVSESFTIQQPDLEVIVNQKIETNPEIVYAVALGIQPYVKSAEIDVKNADVGIKIAKSEALPSLVLNGGVGTGYDSKIEYSSFGQQFSKSMTPYVGLSLSIPIFQQKQLNTQVKLAEIQTDNAKLKLADVRNTLRKYIEQACTDVQTAQSNYVSFGEQLEAEQESYAVVREMFAQGMVNSVDFLLSKNKLAVAENKLTQAKYKLILQKKIVEYYLGNSIKL